MYIYVHYNIKLQCQFVISVCMLYYDFIIIITFNTMNVIMTGNVIIKNISTCKQTRWKQCFIVNVKQILSIYMNKRAHTSCVTSIMSCFFSMTDLQRCTSKLFVTRKSGRRWRESKQRGIGLFKESQDTGNMSSWWGYTRRKKNWNSESKKNVIRVLSNTKSLSGCARKQDERMRKD